jgi:iron complex outermembrane recepter protein
VATCSPGNVFAVTSASLPGLNSAVAAIRPGVTGRPTVDDFIATQGAQNLCSFVKDSVLIPAVNREGVLASGRLEVTRSVEAFVELLFAHARSSSISPFLATTLVVPASNTFNPFGVSVTVSNELAIPSGSVTFKNYFRSLAGLRGRLLSKWHWEVALWRTQDYSSQYAKAITQFGPRTVALASSDPTTALNPFSSTNSALASVLSSVFPTRSNLFHFNVNVVDGTLRGPLFDLPAGPVSFAVGGEYQMQTYFADPRSISPGSSVSDVSRKIGAIYSELRVPIFGTRGHSGDLVDLSLAGRYDRYSDFGGKATPQAGVEIRPVDGLLLRASYAKAFKAPQLPQLYGDQSIFPGLTIPDNGRPGNPITPNVTAIFGGNRHLQAETGNAYSLGAVWTDGSAPGLKASLDYWWLGEDNRITNPSLAAVLGNPSAFPGRVVRDPNGVLLSVDIRTVNFGSLRAEGLDLDLAQSFDTAWGEFTASADWVRTTKFTAALIPGAPLVNRLGQATAFDAWAVKNKATFGLSWHSGRYSLHGSARYLGPYRDYETAPPNANRLGNYVLLDVSGRLDLGALGRNKYFQHAALTASVVNLFDKDPQFSNFPGGAGYDPVQADLLGRMVRLGLVLDR